LDVHHRITDDQSMINIITVHWQTAKWVDPQLRFIERNIDAPVRVFASVNGVEDPRVAGRFHFAADLPGSHPEKLNELARTVAACSSPADILIFLDGDAFPVRPLVPWLGQVLRSYPLLAIRRDENLADPQPHPSFCATTVGFWQEIGGDWRPGDTWINAAGREVADTGGRLLALLRDMGVEWLPLLRTNTYNPHAVWFGVYAHRIYHHGVGFQAARVERVDWSSRYERNASSGRDLRPTDERPSLGTLRSALAQDASALRRVRPRHAAVVARAALKTVRLRQEHRYFERQRRSDRGERLDDLYDTVFDRLCSDPDFFREFDDSDPPWPEPGTGGG
jgi:hypothetical protein